MGNRTIRSNQTDSVVEDRLSPVSRSIWHGTPKKKSVLSINDDGTIPHSVSSKLTNGDVFVTSYKDSTNNKRRWVVKINNEIKTFDLEES